ncbi:SUMF1/EgtB/PvdO family nonheme iron enzyme [bacterium]|nr:SUMF1/EgtB/PvdO family nonheme iron enzyme [bacterium]
MPKFSKIIAIFLIVLLVSCSSSKSQNDSDILPDGDYDSSYAENLDDDSDEYIEPIYPDPVCIYIYPGQEDSKLCFGPKKTNVKCNANPKENEYVTVIKTENSIGDTEGSMDINDDFVFFVLNPKSSSECFKGKTYCPNIYGCNRKNGYVYEIVSSKFIHHIFAVDGDKMVFNLWDNVKSDTYKSDLLLVGNLKTNRMTRIGQWGLYERVQMKYPYVVSLTSMELTHGLAVFNLESNTRKDISELSWCEKFISSDDKNLVCVGYYLPYAADDKMVNINSWMVDLETYEVTPLSVQAHDSENAYINGDYAFIGSGRDLVYYSDSLGKLSGMEIYSFNIKTKREEKWTPEIKGIFEGNFTMPSFEYPYFSYLANETEQTSTGASYVLNIETGKVTKFWGRTSDWSIIKNRYILENGDFPDKLAKLPDLPKLPENADELCEDDNPCTDNRYFVTDGECHFIPNHERCDDGDDTTLFDVCIDGECKGFAGTSSDEEMVTVEAGKFFYDGKEYEIKKPFKMDVFEVTNGKYAQCVEAKACVEPLRKRSLTVLNYYDNPFYENFPVLYVNQFEAQNYCNWLGKRLPTEFEWMKATWDGEEKTYLWGEEKPDSSTYPDSYYANVGFGYPGFVGWNVVEVGTFPKDKTIDGIMDMSGNVSEWTTSEWIPQLCDTPPCHGDFGRDIVVAKGGGYLSGAELKTRYYSTPWTHSFFVGFRCVKDIE